LLGNALSRFQDELSSRPERSVVERSAVFFSSLTQTLKRMTKVELSSA
jgi:hypothetical protein